MFLAPEGNVSALLRRDMRMAFPIDSLRTKGAEMFHAAKSCLLELQPHNESDALVPDVHGVSQEALTACLSSASLKNMWVLRPSETYRSCGELAKNQHSSLRITIPNGRFRDDTERHRSFQLFCAYLWRI